LGLREATAMIEEEGLPAVLARHRRLSAALRAGCEALGLPIFPTAPILSATVTAARVPAGLDGATIVRHMHARYRTVIAGQRTKLSGRSSASASWGGSRRAIFSPICTISNARCATSASRRRP